MIVGSSALRAVLYSEPDAARYETAIASNEGCRMSVANVLEASIVLEARRGAAAGDELDTFLKDAAIEPTPITVEHVDAARGAWRRSCNGNHPAALDFGDYFAYALADVTGEPLLFKGEDFARTDVEAA